MASVRANSRVVRDFIWNRGNLNVSNVDAYG